MSIDCRDGYRIVHQLGQLSLSVSSAGFLLPTVDGQHMVPLTSYASEGHGDAKAARAKYLLEAMCRFFNAGGSEEVFKSLCISFVSATKKLPSIDIEPITLLDCREEVERQDIFFDASTDQVTIVDPDVCADRMSRHKYLEFMTEEDSAILDLAEDEDGVPDIQHTSCVGFEMYD